jgi:hypothetical protein
MTEITDELAMLIEIETGSVLAKWIKEINKRTAASCLSRGKVRRVGYSVSATPEVCDKEMAGWECSMGPE